MFLRMDGLLLDVHGEGDMSDRKVTIEKTPKGVKASLTPSEGIKAQNGSTPGNTSGIKHNMGQLKELSGLVKRIQLGNMAGLQYEGMRDLYTVFGYKKTPTADDFLAKYVRQDIATRIIDAPPLATWSNPPTIEDEGQNDTWDELDRAVKLWPTIYRADRLARLNSYSLLLLGFDDSGQLERPLKAKKAKAMLWARAIPARLVEEIVFDTNPKSRRFGFPDVYTVRFDDPQSKTTAKTTMGMKDMKVHHSRVVHIVENALEDEVFGIPIIEKVYNLLDDLLKVAGGTSETYWLTGNRGMQADIDPEMELNPEDAAALSDELDEYMHQLRRVIRTRGVELNTLESKPPSPKEVFAMIMALISGTTGIPQRILIGSEAGQLASEQDRANWAERIEERRSLYAEPNILEPLVDILQEIGLLSDVDVEWVWPTAFIQNPLEKGQTMAQQARAIGNISRQTGNKVPMQLTSRTEGREILGLEGDLPEEDILDVEPEVVEVKVPVGEDDDSTGPGTKPEEDKPPTDED